MGTDKPVVRKGSTETKKSMLPLLAGAAVLLVAFVLFSQVNIIGENGDSKLSPKQAAKLEKRLKEIDDSEQL